MFGKRVSLATGWFAVAVAALLFTFAGPQPVQAEQVVWKGITPWPKTLIYSVGFFHLQEKVAEKMSDALRLKYLGGSEVYPQKAQFAALKDGAVDIQLLPASYYKGQLPIASANQFTNQGPTVLRANGYYDLMRKLHLDRGGVIFLMKSGVVPRGEFQIYSKKPITMIDDFKGLKIRAFGNVVPMMKALGATPVVVSTGEMYTALERGVVDAIAYGRMGSINFGLHEISKYILKQYFFAQSSAILVNLNSWNMLSKADQNRLNQVAVETELGLKDYLVSQYLLEDGKLKAKGVKFTNFKSAADAKTFNAAARDAGWNAIIAKDPEVGAKLRRLGYKGE
jgi:TRAP-type C4-dicarboxylate transport system substrate-binding protein